MRLLLRHFFCSVILLFRTPSICSSKYLQMFMFYLSLVTLINSDVKVVKVIRTFLIWGRENFP